MLGICGGFQMMGRSVSDPNGLEGDAGTTPGLELLNMTTRMVAGKTLKDVSGELTLGSGRPGFTGYEMHNGISCGPALERPMATLNGQPEGAVSEDGQIIGTYVHGIFDQPEATREILEWAGLGAQHQAVDYKAHRLEQLDRLADLVEECLDTGFLKHLLGLNRRH